MTAKVFVDTNVLVYSRDASEPHKQAQAMAWMAHLWHTKTGKLSYQVLQEFYITVTAKLQPGLDPENARKDVRALLAWRPIVVNDRVFENAWLIQDRCQLSWWDSLTEDLQADQEFGSLRVTNPFHVDPASLVD
jgi:predicted nucleic acid-binding protein